MSRRNLSIISLVTTVFVFAIFSAVTAGQTSAQVTCPPNVVGTLAFHSTDLTSPDFNGKIQIWDVGSRTSHRLREKAINGPLTAAANPQFSADGRYITFMGQETTRPDTKDIFIYDSVTNDLSNLSLQLLQRGFLAADWVDEDPSFHPDGTKLVFKRRNGPTGPGFSSDLWEVELDPVSLNPTSVRQLTFTPDNQESGPRYSPGQGDIIVFWIGVAENADVWKISATNGPTSGDPTRGLIHVARDNGFQEFFPVFQDADNLMYVRGESSDELNDEIYVYDISGGIHTSALLNTSSDESDPFAIQGNVIGFSSTRAGGFGGYDLYIGELDTTDQPCWLKFFNSTMDDVGGAYSAQTMSSLELDQSIGVPAYFYPAGAALALWDQLETSYPAAAITIMNPAVYNLDDPLENPLERANWEEPNYSAVAISSRAAGQTVLGYVPTGRGNRAGYLIKSDIDILYDRFSVDGIFFDEVSPDCDPVLGPVSAASSTYAELYSYVKGKAGEAMVALNPGAHSDSSECYMPVADILMTFEGFYEEPAEKDPGQWYLDDFTQVDWVNDYEPGRFWHLVHTTGDVEDMENAILLSKRRNAGWVYVTDDPHLPYDPVLDRFVGNQWDTVPAPIPYWNREIDAVLSPIPTQQALWVFPEASNPITITDPAHRKELVERASASGVDTLYVSVYSNTLNSLGRRMYANEHIADLIAEAHWQGIKVWAAYGAPDWADVPDSQIFALDRVQEVIDYNTDSVSLGFDGIIFDVEPPGEQFVIDNADWLPQGYEYWDQRSTQAKLDWFSGLLTLYQRVLDEKLNPINQSQPAPPKLKFAAAIQASWNTTSPPPSGVGTPKPVYEHIIDMDLDNVVVMGYRDTAGSSDCSQIDGIICLVQDEFAYADSTGKANYVLAGIETSDCVPGCGPDKVSFFEEGQDILNQETRAVAEEFATSLSFGGFAIHRYQHPGQGDGYLAGAPRWPEFNSRFYGECGGVSDDHAVICHAYWRFEEGAGGNAVDSSGNGYTGGVSAEYTTDTPSVSGTNNGYALLLDGSGQRVVAAEQPLVLANGLTIEAYIKPAQGSLPIQADGEGNRTEYIVWTGDDLYSLSLRSDPSDPGAVTFLEGHVTCESYPTTVTASAPFTESPNGEFSHVAMTFGSGTLRLFIDGTEAATASDSQCGSQVGPSLGAPFIVIGSDEYTGVAGFENHNVAFDGVIDEVRISGRPLVSSEFLNSDSDPAADSDGNGLSDSFENSFGGNGVSVTGQASSVGDAPGGSTIESGGFTVTFPAGTQTENASTTIGITLETDAGGNPRMQVAGVSLPAGETKAVELPLSGNGAVCIDDSATADVETLLATGLCPTVLIEVPGVVGQSGNVDFNTGLDTSYTVTRLQDDRVMIQGLQNTAVATTNSPCLTVTNTGDSGPGSLRGAIDCANAQPGVDTIEFDIPGAGPHSIHPISPLPDITEPVIINGYSQHDAAENTDPDGFNGALMIELNGTSTGPATVGLRITGGGSTIRGLVINRFDGVGIKLENAGGNVVEGNFIGTDVTGTLDYGNVGNPEVGTKKVGSGIDTTGSSDNTIGGTTPAARNVISGNDHNGITSLDNTNVVIQGNFIGTDASGTANLGNGRTGVQMANGGFHVIGGPGGARNVISGNVSNGIEVHSGPRGVRIENNYIGTDVSGTVAIKNRFAGVSVEARDTEVVNNLISGNRMGVRISTIRDGNILRGNLIGTDASGASALGNTEFGVRIVDSPNNTIGGIGAGEGNVISTNAGHGIFITGSTADGNIIVGNRIGTDALGTIDLGNAGSGINIGLDADDTTIGGTLVGAGNLIAFNDDVGVRIVGDSSAISVRRNSIFDNGSLGIDLVGGTENTFGVTENDFADTDDGPNFQQNYPVITDVSSATGAISGTFNGATGTQFTLEFYSNSACDPSGFGEGETFLGDISVVTDGSGNATFALVPSQPASPDAFITAVAVDPSGNTSEFSACATTDDNRLKLLVPAYGNPWCCEGLEMWDTLISTAQSSDVELHVILNPHNGPGLDTNGEEPGIDLNYVNDSGQGALIDLRNAGAVIYGYVSTNYTRDIATTTSRVLKDIDRYYGVDPDVPDYWRGTGVQIDGIFFDEVSDKLEHVGWYHQIRDHVRSLDPTATVIGNPGTFDVDENSPLYTVTDYVESADVMVTFENFGAQYRTNYTPPSWRDDYPSDRFAHIAHTEASIVDMLTDLELARARKASMVYVTDDVYIAGVDQNPYNVLATYWDEMVEWLEKTDQDEDGIFDEVDEVPGSDSDDFSDGTTIGQVTDWGDQFLTVKDAPDPTDGVVITVDPTGGPTPATIAMSGGSCVANSNPASSFTVTPGDVVIATCGSVTVESVSGTIEVTLVGNDGSTGAVDLSEGNGLTFQPDTLAITTPPTNSGTVVVVVGGEELPAEPGSSTSLDLTPPDLALPAAITARASEANGALVVYSVFASDLVDPSPSVICHPGSGSTFAVGITAVDCTATDLAGNTSSDGFNVIVVDDCDCTEGKGFWKNEFKKADQGKTKGRHFDDSTLESYLDIVDYSSEIFESMTIASANEVFNPQKSKGKDRDGSRNGSKSKDADNSRSNTNRKKKGGDDSGSDSGKANNLEKKRQDATSQLLSAWLNYAKGAVELDEQIEIDSGGDDSGSKSNTRKRKKSEAAVTMSFNEIVAEVETILANPDATKGDLERAKDLAESVNVHDKDNPDCDTGSGSGSKSGSGSNSKSKDDSGSKRWRR